MARRHVLVFGLFLPLAGIASARAEAPSAAVQHVLAPSGALRVGVYVGSPSSIIPGKTPEDAKGVGYDLGKALAASLGVPFTPVIFPSNDPLLQAMKAQSIDVTFTNATAARAKDMDFSESFMDVEKSFLVSANSPIKTLTDLDRSGLVAGVSQGSSTAGELHPLFPKLEIDPVPTLKEAADLLISHKIDAFATNKAILFQLSDGVPNSRVLDGHWGMEHFASAIPKGREAGMDFLNGFIETEKHNGTITAAIQRAGLRGTVAAGEAK